MKAGLMAVALAGMLGSGAAMAADLRYDGNELLGQCQEYIKAADKEKNYSVYDVAMCAGYTQGVVNAVYFYSDTLKKDEKFCMPETVTNGQVVRIVVKYLKDNPKDLNEGRMSLVWSALMDAYPCK
jgi:hypothetical protein